ncbi:MAG TPA: hypothetical protein VII73_10975 [Caulobacteraceae bacterium]
MGIVRQCVRIDGRLMDYSGSLPSDLAEIRSLAGADWRFAIEQKPAERAQGVINEADEVARVALSEELVKYRAESRRQSGVEGVQKTRHPFGRTEPSTIAAQENFGDGLI